MRLHLGGTIVTLHWPWKSPASLGTAVAIIVLTLFVVMLLVTKQRVELDDRPSLVNKNNEKSFLAAIVPKGKVAAADDDDSKLAPAALLLKKTRFARLAPEPDEARIVGKDGLKIVRDFQAAADMMVGGRVPIRFNQQQQEEKITTPPPMVMELVRERKAAIDRVAKGYIRGQNRQADRLYNINVTFSDGLSLDRDLPDTRPPVCRTISYPSTSLTVTVIIPFYNEALSMLLRALHSVLNRTPVNLLDEVILVDDRSTHDHLADTRLEDYVKLFQRVRLLRNEKRVGLVVSRMNGYRASRSPVVVFMDAHAEVNDHWLPPLLDELERHPNSVIQPFIDGIDAMSLRYTAPTVFHKGSFSWDLRYTWTRYAEHEQRRAEETGYPLFTPTLVGCAIAVRRDYFDRIGHFDENLKVWGGENIELAFRVWMCGGRVVTVTCSRIGHVFKDFPYKFDGNKEEIVHKNLIRVSETWMDGMRKYFYASTRVYEFKRAELNEEETKSLQVRQQLRSSLQCKNFEWFMNNIIPEFEEPPMSAVMYGEIMNLRTRACFEVLPDYYIGMTYLCYDHKIIPENNFHINKQGLMVYRDKCVGISPPSPVLRLVECPQDPATFEYFGLWTVEGQGPTWGRLVVRQRVDKNTVITFCIVQVTNALDEHRGEQMPQLADCTPNDFSSWSFTYKFDWQQVPRHLL